jgi:hypothetical protein
MVRSCHHSKSSAQSRPPFFTKEIEHSLFYSPRYNIIAQKTNKVHKIGWHCHVERLYTRYYKTFLRDEVIENEFISNEALSPTECEIMVRDKTCLITKRWLFMRLCGTS